MILGHAYKIIISWRVRRACTSNGFGIGIGPSQSFPSKKSNVTFEIGSNALVGGETWSFRPWMCWDEGLVVHDEPGD